MKENAIPDASVEGAAITDSASRRGVRVAENVVTERIIGAAIEVHRTLGPGLLEGVYQEAMRIELCEGGLACQPEVNVPVMYKDRQLNSDLRLDLLVEGRVVVELKSLEVMLPVHKAQLLTYLRLSDHKVGLLINFNVPSLARGVSRVVNGLPEPDRPASIE